MEIGGRELVSLTLYLGQSKFSTDPKLPLFG